MQLPLCDNEESILTGCKPDTDEYIDQFAIDVWVGPKDDLLVRRCQQTVLVPVGDVSRGLSTSR